MAESAPPLVLVTGASGFVSTWLIKELLEKGEYRVRGTVRDKSKEEKVCSQYIHVASQLARLS